MLERELGVFARHFGDFQEFHGDNAALTFFSNGSAQSITYAELSRLADTWRDRLQEMAPVAAPLLALEFETSVEAVAAYLGALRSGFPLLIAEPGQLAGESRLLELYEPELIIARRNDGFDVRRSERTRGFPAPHPDLQVLLSTSGTTGDPKLVRLSEDNIASNACAIAEYLGLRPSDRAATTLPFFYSYGLSVLNSYLAAGASIALIHESVSSPEFWDCARLMGVTSLAFVPHQIELLDAAGYARMQLPSLRYVTQAGGRLDPAMAQRLHARGQSAGWDLVMMYGQTEAAPRISYVPPDQLPDAADTIGRAIPGGRLHILDQDGTPIASPGQPGELVYQGPNVMMGYALRREDLAKDREMTELRTGDLAEMTPEGLFRITGRLKRFVKLYGLRLSLDQIEAMLARQGIAAHAVAVDDELVLLHLDSVRGDAAREAVGREYGVPEGRLHAAPLSETPVLPSGKTDHKALAVHAARALAQAAQQRPEPVDLAQLFRRATRSREVRPSDSFVSLGGDSMSYLEVQLALEETLGTLSNYWERMSLAELQALLDDPRPTTSTMRLSIDVPMRLAATSLVVMQHATSYPLSGGALVLILLIGFSMGRFQVNLLARGQALRFARQMLVPIVPLYRLILLSYETMAADEDAPLSYLLLLGNYHVWTENALLEPYWFVSLYAQVIAVVALASLLPGVGRRLAAGPWSLLSLVFWPLMATHILLEVLDLYGLSYLHFGSIRTRGLLECLPIFLLGWMLQAAATPRQWTMAAVASSVWLASSVHVLPPDRLVIFSSALLLLLWKPDLSVPRAWGRAASRLASTTMWVYLLHVPIITVLWGLPLPQPVRLTIALVTSFGLSLAAKAVFDRLSDGLMRAKAPTRPLASKAEGTGVDLGERDF